MWDGGTKQRHGMDRGNSYRIFFVVLQRNKIQNRRQRKCECVCVHHIYRIHLEKIKHGCQTGPWSAGQEGRNIELGTRNGTKSRHAPKHERSRKEAGGMRECVGGGTEQTFEKSRRRGRTVPFSTPVYRFWRYKTVEMELVNMICYGPGSKSSRGYGTERYVREQNPRKEWSVTEVILRSRGSVAEAWRPDSLCEGRTEGD